LGKVTSLAGHQRVYLDANIIIYLVEGVAPYAERAQPLLQAMAAGSVEALTSELTLAEVLVGPIRAGNDVVRDAYTTFLYRSIGLAMIDVSREILTASAQLRAATSLRLPDAIHAATAQHAGCTAFLTNDERLKSISGVETVLLKDLSAA
jgi:predicted nucleic acid-binding protein